MAAKSKTNSKKDGAIVVPVRKVKTKSGIDAKTLLSDEQMEKEVEAKLPKGEDLGKDLRIVDGKVLIKFPKFVHLVVMHDFEEVMKKHETEDIVISSDLLVDLANAHDETEQQLPWGYLIIGIVLGVVFAIIAIQIVL